jgi:DNA-binding FrmR family transcriptional regulator
MIEEDRECMEVLRQVAASAGALRSVGMVILEDHLKGCVKSAILNEEDEEHTIHQVIEIFNKFTK